MKLDNRMRWVRTAEAAAKAEETYELVYEFFSEAYIPGILEHENLKVGLILENPKSGLHNYQLIVKLPTNIGVAESDLEPTKNGYYSRGEVFELLNLFCIFFQCRFFLRHVISYVHTTKGIPFRGKFTNFYRYVDPVVDQHVFSEKKCNWAEIVPFLVKIQKLEFYNLEFSLSFQLYSKALKNIGIDHEIAYIQLVSAIEAFSSSDSKIVVLDEEDKIEAAAVDKMIENSEFSTDIKDELKNLFKYRKVQKKFILFITRNIGNYFEKDKTDLYKINAGNFENILKNIHKGRSNYLHAGHKMYLSDEMFKELNTDWDFDPSTGQIIDNRKWSKEEQLPYIASFENIVRTCILNFLDSVYFKQLF
jgi:hypothetical protein